MKKSLLLFSMCLWYLVGSSQQVSLINDQQGSQILVNGKPFFVKGMNWDYFPIGTNYSYSFWNQSDEFIQTALQEEMGLLKNMGVNSIRVYTGIPKKWIEYIYSNFGIYTMLNHSFGRYGLTIDGVWKPNTNYGDKKTQELLLQEVKELAESYKNTPGLLLFLLGNENNYGLFWEGAETEDIPVKDRKSTQKAESMYKLFNEAARTMKSIDSNHPIAICNGDLLFLDIIARDCPDIDIFGTNVYRGISFTDLYDRVKNEYGKPVLLTEFGSDAFNALSNTEDQNMQAQFLKGNWKEIYENAHGAGKAGNSIGGYTFQFSDGWWKFGQTKNLDVHDQNASWSNGGYYFDYSPNENNMNEEWFGICAKGPTNEKGFYQLYPRAAYYLLKDIHQFSPQEKSVSEISSFFQNINIMDAALKARSDKAALNSESNSKIKLSRFSLQSTTFNTGGRLITTPEDPIENNTTFPNKLGFDHMQSFFIGVEANPASNMRAKVEFNVLGNVAQNPIDEVFYENRGIPKIVDGPNGPIVIQDRNRVQLYRASYSWNHSHFNLEGFYRTGHYHWGYEGDFFGLYPEANYGPNMDIYNGEAPFGFEIEAKKALKGLKIAFGPQLWWGANPAVLAKYAREFGKIKVTGMFHEDLEQQGLTGSSFAIPQPKTRRTTLAVSRSFNNLKIDLGGIWAGAPLNGRVYQVQRGTDENATIYQHEIESKDNWGGKMKLTYTGGKFNWYAQGAAQGLVANGGADLTQTFTGWTLKDNGSGNQYNFLTGFTFMVGKIQIAPNFLWQKPIEGPIDANAPAPGKPRNILADPFVVRANREQIAGELLFTFDPTPATWMYSWESDQIEDARFAASAGIIYRHLPTTQDAAIGILANGRTFFAFDGAAPARDLWEAQLRLVSKYAKNAGVIANFYAGDAQANGSDARTVRRFGTDIRFIYKKIKLSSFAKINDWGPFDYHRDFNLTYPMQLMLDLSTELGKPDWFVLPNTRLGIRGTFRTLNQYSPRYNPTQMIDPDGNWVPNPTAIGFPNGNEWEIRTYLHINIGK